MKNERKNALKNAGIDTSKFFTLMVNKNIPAGSTISIMVNKPDEKEMDIENEILENGYVKNTKLWRRYVAAQYMRMLSYSGGYHRYLKDYYGYMYQLSMMTNEIRILGHLEREDIESFNERKRFFTLQVVNRILADYVDAVKKYIPTLKVKKCHGEPYVDIKGYGYVFVRNIENDVIGNIESAVASCKTAKTYRAMYDYLVALNNRLVILPYGTKKSSNWIDAFQCEGAFYTLKNLILFHGVRLYYENDFHEMYESMRIINSCADTYEGYKMNALLKETIKRNNFDFVSSVQRSVDERRNG